MMMLKMMNPFGSVTDSIPGVGGGGGDSDDGISKEEAEEQEKLRQDAIRQAEKERRDKYKKQEEEREGMRQTIRDKVICCLIYSGEQFKIGRHFHAFVNICFVYRSCLLEFCFFSWS